MHFLLQKIGFFSIAFLSDHAMMKYLREIIENRKKLHLTSWNKTKALFLQKYWAFYGKQVEIFTL